MQPICSDQIQARLQVLTDHEHEERPALEGQRSSAVLIPILRREGNPILYTLRSRHLKHHANQFSFPGGVVEDGESPWQAALREAEEEIGLEPGRVTRMGRISDVYSPRGFHIQCFVGLVDPFEPRLNEQEVERVIEVHMSQLFESQRHSLRPFMNRYKVHYFDFSEGLVWGVTGQITYNLREALL
ncbi:CoA pyrophosphatase [Sulfidibacter corallicola]|uniref:CoA pyrophosphatase n=1 Tax=Sulfidibacter corallicola TaxID=2818388 RepID=A0A8A4TVX7_SULCO|nr:CoA pyrophosphatase [Sulfidibacter corallicola]QTD54116.1 CoA pyrophosphatase [Sulfidibacter corallicola]